MQINIYHLTNYSTEDEPLKEAKIAAQTCTNEFTRLGSNFDFLKVFTALPIFCLNFLVGQ